MKLTKELINGMVKYINMMYSPKRIEVEHSNYTFFEVPDTWRGITLIDVYFDMDADIDYDTMVNMDNKIPNEVKSFFPISSLLRDKELLIRVFFE